MSEELDHKEKTESTPEVSPKETPKEEPKVETPVVPTPVEEPKKEEPKEEEPQVVVQKEKGFTYYVGFAFIFVIGLFLFFVPGLVITYGVSSLVGGLPLTATWLFSAILSVIIWIIFKVKIKGFKKTFYWYLGLAILILAAFVGIDVATEGHHISKVMNMMIGTPTPDKVVLVPVPTTVQFSTEANVQQAEPAVAPAAESAEAPTPVSDSTATSNP